jgi:hypothetical protein
MGRFMGSKREAKFNVGDVLLLKRDSVYGKTTLIQIQRVYKVIDKSHEYFCFAYHPGCTRPIGYTYEEHFLEESNDYLGHGRECLRFYRKVFGV